ncbi:MAG: glycosyltransferase [Breznakibacter sp.]
MGESKKNIRFLVVSYAWHKYDDQRNYYSYAPYVREMNLWLKHVDAVTIVAPLGHTKPDALDMAYRHPNLHFVKVPALNLQSFPAAMSTFVRLPLVVWVLFREMHRANHIHLRCPGNMGLVASFVQLFFPGKIKTVKYANNWDWNSTQPWTYRLQQRILRNEWLTHRTKVLVYGDWGEKSRHIVPFYTASYTNADKLPVSVRDISDKQPVRLVFVGTLTANKRPLVAVKTLKRLLDSGIDAQLTLIGGGNQEAMLRQAVEEMDVAHRVVFTGKISPGEVIGYFQKSHFLVFMSMSEGWPKVVAEAMWWGCVPVSTRVSCVHSMLGNGMRGVLVEPDAQLVAKAILDLITNDNAYRQMAMSGMEWAREYTLERFEEDVVKLLHDESSFT